MPISYDKLFKLLEDRQISTYYLRQNKIIGQQTYYNLKNGKGNLGTETLEKLCDLLHCQPGELMEYVPDSLHATNANQQTISHRSETTQTISQESSEEQTISQKSDTTQTFNRRNDEVKSFDKITK